MWIILGLNLGEMTLKVIWYVPLKLVRTQMVSMRIPWIIWQLTRFVESKNFFRGSRKETDGNGSVSVSVCGLSEMSSVEFKSNYPEELESGLLAIIGFEKQITSDSSDSVTL